MINAVCEIHGIIKTAENVSGFIYDSGNMTGTVAIGSGFATDKYEGSYSVEPKLREDQVLPTKDKVMVNDLTVTKVPVYKTKNATGGYTIYVAERVDE